MCRSLGMLLAQCWLPDSTGEFLIASGAPFCMGDVMTLPYRQLSEQITLRRGQGPVGRAMEKGGIIWVDDVQNGSQVEWPLHHATALLGLHGMCACRVLVQKKDGEKTEAVLELYFPGNLKTPEQQQPCVDAIWNHLHGSSTVSMCGSAGDSENPGAGGQPIPTDISNLDPSPSAGRCLTSTRPTLRRRGARGRRQAAVGHHARDAPETLLETSQGSREGPRRRLDHAQANLPPLRHLAVAP